MNTAGTLAAFLKTLPPRTTILVDGEHDFDVTKAGEGVLIKANKPKSKKVEPKAGPKAKARAKAEGAKA